MIHLTLTEDPRQELERRLRQRKPSPVPALRLEMVRLAAAGWRIPQIARHLGCHEQTVRKFVKAFRDQGFPGLADRPRPGRTRRLTDEHLAALEQTLDQTDRTWTTPQLAAWLEREQGVRVHPDYLSRVLHRRRFAWKRTKRSVAHKRKESDCYEAKAAEVADLKKQAQQGVIDLFFFDQSGFAPTLPTGYTWCRIGQRKLVRYEAPQRRRVNVAGALAPYAAGGPELVFESRRTDQGKYDAAAHLRFLARLGGLPQPLPPGWRRERPCVVVLDNYSVHHSRAVKEQLPALEAAGVRCFFLPPYSPELNEIEPLWRQVKYQDLPDRSHTTAQALQEAVEAALSKRAEQYRKPTTDLPRPA